jgi:hypothetical protein
MANLIFQPSETTHWKTLFPNKMLLLGSQNLNEGEELIAEIKGVDVNEIRNQDGKTELVPVAKFTNAPPMVLNITNTRTIANLYGDSYEGWVGKSIQLFAANVKAFGKEGLALRVREAIPDTNESLESYEIELRACKNTAELQKEFTQIPKHLKPRMVEIKNEMKEKLDAS